MEDSQFMEELQVKVIYSAFMGECNQYGIGAQCTFIRLSGCNLLCYHSTKGCLCDTPEALAKTSGKKMTASEILYEVFALGNRIVCLTGGEPLLQDVRELLTMLVRNGFKVVVETNGSRNIEPYRHIKDVSFVVDVKSPSSGESARMLEGNYELLDEKDFVKFVIDTEEDFTAFTQWLVSHDWIKCQVGVGLFWGSEVTYQWLMKNLLRLKKRVYLNAQMHKMACLYDFYKKDKTFSHLFIPKNI